MIKTLMKVFSFSCWLYDFYVPLIFLLVILDSSGYTKGYGFVRFGNEDEQRNALYAMNGYTGLGTKPLKICTAVPKPKGPTTTQNQPTTVTTTPTYSSGAVRFDICI